MTGRGIRGLAAAILAFALFFTGCDASEAERQRAASAAQDAFSLRVANGGCSEGGDIDHDFQAVEELVGKAAANAGWIEPESIFVGSQADLATSLGASFVARAGSELWVLAEVPRPRLLHLIDRGSFFKPAFVVTSFQQAC